MRVMTLAMLHVLLLQAELTYQYSLVCHIDHPINTIYFRKRVRVCDVYTKKEGNKKIRIHIYVYMINVEKISPLGRSLMIG